MPVAGMKILGIGEYNELGSIYLRLIEEGHDVRVHIAAEDSRDVLAGMIELVPSWEEALPWIREAGDAGLILFEDSGYGELQDRLRREGFRVVGGSAFGDRLEQDRVLGQDILRRAGLRTAATHPFSDFDAALAFVAEHPARYVLKFNGTDLPSDANYVGMRVDGADIVAMLMHHQRRWAEDHEQPPDFLLMDHLRGIETGVGALFNGTEFVGPFNLDWEHKRFFPGDLGELTGEMGTVVSYRGAEKLFAATLGRVGPELRAAGHVGYVNLNMIINNDGVWPLEFTCRFGYPGFAILSAMFEEDCGTILGRIAAGSPAPIATADGYAVGIVLTVPPFPYHYGYEHLSKGTPICLPAELSADERRHLHFAEVRRDGALLVTAGQIGYVMVVTGRGATVAAAQRSAYELAEKVAVPKVRYRIDIGDSLRTTGLAELARLGWI